MEVTAHAGARPEHAEWQGKIYSRSGKSKKYPSLKDKTGYGTGPGLGGWNCRHSMFPFYEGSTRAYTDEELEELKHINENIKLNDNKNISNNSNTNNNTGKSKYLNASSKELCDKVYDKFKENNYENIGLINTINNKVLGDIHTSNNKNEVKLSIKQQNLLALQDNRSVLLVHNHPSNATFSKNDISSLIANKKICGIIAVGDKFNYFLEINQKEFSKNIKFNEIWYEILGEVNKIIKNDIKNSKMFTNEVLHNVYVTVFKKRGWNYGREKRI